MKKEIDRYIREIRRELRLPYKVKKRIIMELTSEIYARVGEGEQLDDVLHSIGSPWEVTRELESSYEEESMQLKKGGVLKLVVLSVIACCMAVLMAYSVITMIYPQLIRPIVIGGADGNTSIFLAYKWSVREMIAGLMIKAVIFAVSLLQAVKIFKRLKYGKRM